MKKQNFFLNLESKQQSNLKETFLRWIKHVFTVLAGPEGLNPFVIDSQEHILECLKISVLACKGIATNKIEYEPLDSDMRKQK